MIQEAPPNSTVSIPEPLARTLGLRTTGVLARYGFDAARFSAQAEELREHGLRPERNHVRSPLGPPQEGAIEDLPEVGSAGHTALVNAGSAALARGEVATVVLAGGMATRFGGRGVVKAVVDVVPGLSFLACKIRLADAAAARAGGRPPPLLAMTSFATDEAVRAALGNDARLRAFAQFVSVRLDARGEIFRDEAQEPSLYAPGHGDLPEAILARGELERLRSAGVRTIWVSNVDNLSATIDPAILGWFLDHNHSHRHMRGASVGVEVCPLSPGDVGGAPAQMDGRVQVIEGFRFPPSFARDSIPVFNTNTFLIGLDALAAAGPLPFDFFAVEKNVGGRAAVQFERLIGQLTAFLPSAYVRVRRNGPRRRFLPIKDRTALEATRPAIREILAAHGIAEADG